MKQFPVTCAEVETATKLSQIATVVTWPVYLMNERCNETILLPLQHQPQNDVALCANTLGMLTCFTFNFFAPGITFAFFATGTATLAVTPGFTFAFFETGTATLDVTATLFRFLDLSASPEHKPKKTIITVPY
jgi:hypothetical protein